MNQINIPYSGIYFLNWNSPPDEIKILYGQNEFFNLLEKIGFIDHLLLFSTSKLEKLIDNLHNFFTENDIIDINHFLSKLYYYLCNLLSKLNDEKSLEDFMNIYKLKIQKHDTLKDIIEDINITFYELKQKEVAYHKEKIIITERVLDEIIILLKNHK